MGLFVREETCCIFSPLLSLAILMVYEGTINIMRGTINSQLYCSTMQYITHPAIPGDSQIGSQLMGTPQWAVNTESVGTKSI